MAQEQGQRWAKFDAIGSISGVFVVRGWWANAPTQTVTMKAPYSSTTATLWKVTSTTGGLGGLGLPVKGTITVSTLGSGATLFIYYE